MMNNVKFLLLILIIVTIPNFCFANSSEYYNIIDEQGTVVYVTGWPVRVGDQCLTDTNKRYEITSIEGTTAHAKFIGNVNLSQYGSTSRFSWWNSILLPPIARAEGQGKVAIYHTHSDESYVPTDGTESILGAGGIYKVGDAFSNALQAEGIQAIHSTAKHDPHDDMAYERSRRTAMDLVKKDQPDAIFDIHRDAVPPEVYKTNINGQDVTKVQLVVGKYGPTSKQIEDYALQLKAASDDKYKGLVKGIFFAKGGDYNQDIHPRSMLLEVGAHTNDRQSAEKGVALFADVIPAILGKTGANPSNATGQAGFGTAQAGPSGATKSIGWIVGLLVVGAGGFLLISTGSLKEAGAKLKQFTKSEFANFLGPKNRKNDKRRK